MGKGYNNYMCKKPFHPGSKANIKRAWMAEQKTENEKRKQDELKAQYEKEQNLYNNRALISSESKDKLELNFMYEAPPGAKRERQKEDDEPEFKFEWQRKYNAPREDYAKGNEDIKDQPFGIPVRNVRCIKCHKWGHINTDKECPLYHQASTSSMPTTSMDPMELMRQMKEDGFGLKENVLGHQLNPAAANQQFIPSDDESDPEIDFLKSLSSAEKKKLLKKLKKLSKKQEKSSNCKKKKKSKKSRKSRPRATDSSDSEKERKAKKKKSKKSSSSDSDSSSDESKKGETKKSKHLEPKEKPMKLEKKESKEHKNMKEPLIEHHTGEKYNRNMSGEDLNLGKHASTKDKAHKPREESPDHSRHKTMKTKHSSKEKYDKETIEKKLNIGRSASKEDFAHKKVRKELRKESPDHSKHKTKESKHEKEIVNSVEEKGKHFSGNFKERGYQSSKTETSHHKDSNIDRHATREDTAHKKLRRESKERSFFEKHETKHDKKSVDSRAENKEKHFSSTSKEERYQAAKTETSPNQTDLPASKRKKTSSHEDSDLDRHASKENIVHKKVISEKSRNTSDHSKHQSKGTKPDVRDAQTGKDVKHPESDLEQEKLKATQTGTVPDDADVPSPKRKHETSQSDDSSNNTHTKMVKYDHPDGFSHLCPQAHIKANYLQPSEEYEGKAHDRFRHHYREKRSPSVKQKYNK